MCFVASVVICLKKALNLIECIFFVYLYNPIFISSFEQYQVYFSVGCPDMILVDMHKFDCETG